MGKYIDFEKLIAEIERFSATEYGDDTFVKQYCLDHESYRKGHTVFTLGWHPHSRVCNIRYVHELQHTMKLCKIDKEIVL